MSFLGRLGRADETHQLAVQPAAVLAEVVRNTLLEIVLRVALDGRDGFLQALDGLLDGRDFVVEIDYHDAAG